MTLNKNKLAAAGLILLGGAIAILALNWNASGIPQSVQQSELSDASGKGMSETHGSRRHRSKRSGKKGHLSYEKKS